MNKIKRKLAADNFGITGLTIAVLWLMGGLGTAISIYAYETYVATEPILNPESTPTLAGFGLESLWVIVALIVAIGFLILIVFGRGAFAPKKS